MGNVRNITHDNFPKQGEDLGSIVTIMVNGDVPVTAAVVRSDAEEPSRKFFRSVDGTYLSASEVYQFQMPEQGSYKGRRTNVCFHYDTSKQLEGIIVRDDMAEPYTTLIHLDDGRVLNDVECQYSPKLDEIEQSQVTQRANPHIERLSTRLKKLKSSERARELHGVYKQLITSRKGKIANGPYNRVVSDNQGPIMDFTVEGLARQIADKVTVNEFVGYVADQMDKYDHLKNHAGRLRESYGGPMKLNFKTVEIDPTLN